MLLNTNGLQAAFGSNNNDVPLLHPPITEATSTQHSDSDTHAHLALSTTERHRKIREEADMQYRRNAERMKVQYTKQKRHKVSYPGVKF